MAASSPRQLSFVEKIASSKVGAWYFIHVTSKLDPWVLKRTDGKLSTLPGNPVLLLIHTGAKTGKERETPLVYATDGDDIILIASKGGAATNPAWYHNLVANPTCAVIANNRSGHYLAEELAGEERAAMWEKALDVYGGYGVYQERTDGRLIPLLRLRRVDP
ncbi:MAG: nitroreductase family deazaflavin-dependent oxidoreductase [Actinomycetota bacterium]